MTDYGPLPDPDVTTLSDYFDAQWKRHGMAYSVDAVRAMLAAERERWTESVLGQHSLRVRELAERCGALQAEADKMAEAISQALHWMQAAGYGDVTAAQQLRASIGSRLAEAAMRRARVLGV